HTVVHAVAVPTGGCRGWADRCGVVGRGTHRNEVRLRGPCAGHYQRHHSEDRAVGHPVPRRTRTVGDRGGDLGGDGLSDVACVRAPLGRGRAVLWSAVRGAERGRGVSLRDPGLASPDTSRSDCPARCSAPETAALRAAYGLQAVRATDGTDPGTVGK